MPAQPVTYERQVPASLHVHLENGETFAAGQSDLGKFGYVRRTDVYSAFRDLLTRKLSEQRLLPGGDLTNAQLNPVRELVEACVYFPVSSADMADTFTRVAVIERFLAENADELAARMAAATGTPVEA